MRPLALLLVAAALLAQEDKHRPRGKSGPPDESQSWTRGRLGTQNPLPGKLLTLDGVLVDAACDDRSAMNLQKPPERNTADRSAPPTTHQHDAAVPESHPGHSHQSSDRSCAITGGTRGFALLTTEGRLLNLDEGGNTLAIQALHANPDGRAMLNGTGGGLKPRATLRGRVQGDRLIVDKVVKL